MKRRWQRQQPPRQKSKRNNKTKVNTIRTITNTTTDRFQILILVNVGWLGFFCSDFSRSALRFSLYLILHISFCFMRILFMVFGFVFFFKYTTHISRQMCRTMVHCSGASLKHQKQKQRN